MTTLQQFCENTIENAVKLKTDVEHYEYQYNKKEQKLSIIEYIDNDVQSSYWFLQYLQFDLARFGKYNILDLETHIEALHMYSHRGSYRDIERLHDVLSGVSWNKIIIDKGHKQKEYTFDANKHKYTITEDDYIDIIGNKPEEKQYTKLFTCEVSKYSDLLKGKQILKYIGYIQMEEKYKDELNPKILCSRVIYKTNEVIEKIQLPSGVPDFVSYTFKIMDLIKNKENEVIEIQ